MELVWRIKTHLKIGAFSRTKKTENKNMTVLLGLASQRPIDGLLLGSALIVCVVKVGACVLAHCERVRKLFFF